MTTVLIVIHLMVVLALIAVVLLQRSEGGALGIGGGGGAFMSRRGAGNLLTRATAFLAAAFFATSIALTILARIESRPADILDELPGTATTVPQLPEGAAVPVAPPESGQDVLEQLRGRSGAAQDAAPAEPVEVPAAPEAPAEGTGRPILIPPAGDTGRP